MYHPHEPTGTETNGGYDEDDFEYVEIRNTGLDTNCLFGVEFVDGIQFDFTYGNVGCVGPGEHVVVVRNFRAFTNRYPNWAGMNIAGEYEGSLDNGGEMLTLSTPLLDIDLDLDYSDGRGWPLSTDGAGHSLVPIVFNQQTNAYLDYGRNWRASTYRSGSPGEADPPPIFDIFINEIAAHTDVDMPPYDSDDWIELFNVASTSISVTTSNWFLSDDPDDLKKWAMPPFVFGSSNWVSFDEITGFHNPITSGFGLNKAGEQVYVSFLPGTASDRVSDAIKFKGQENGVTWGRYRDGQIELYTMIPTRNAANMLAYTNRLVISEIMYHPAPNEFNAEDNNEDEYIVIFNPNPFPVTMMSEGGPWRLDGEVGYTFPSNTVLGSSNYLTVVPFNPTNNVTRSNEFNLVYGLANGEIDIFGGWSGSLDNRGGRIALEREQLPDLEGQDSSWVIVDEVIYFDRDSWPFEADGSGAALHRLDNDVAGNAPSNWAPGNPSLNSPDIGLGPLVVNSAATGIGDTSATLNGALLSTGTAPAQV
ncbi:MAG: hypothetical protein AAF492_17205, partial [Verrucomicrobiota bacterium]